MMKLILLGVIVMASVALGSALADSVGARKRALCGLVNCVKCMQNVMLYQGVPLYEALLRAAGVANGAYFTAVSGLIRERPQESGGLLAAHAREHVALVNMHDEELALFDGLMDALSNAVSQEEAAEAFRSFLRSTDEMLRDVTQTQAKRAKVIKSLCLMGGLLIAVILI